MKQLFILLFILSATRGISQQSLTDSIRNLYDHALTDSAKCYNLAILASEYSNSDIDTALVLAQEAVNMAEKLHNDLLIVKTYDIAGFCHGKKGNEEKAQKFLYDALRLAEKIKCGDCIAYVKNELSVLQKQQNNFKQCLAFLLDAMTVPENELSVRTKFKLYQNAGLCYTNLNQPDSAMFYYKKALPFSDSLKLPYTRAMLINNMAMVYHLGGNLDQARESYAEVEKIGKAIGNSELLFLAAYNTGDIYLREKNTAAARQYFENSIPFAEKIKRNDYLMYAYGSLLEANEKEGNTAAALRYFHLYDVVKDSVNLQQHNRNVTELATRYQTEKKESMIKLQQLELESKTAAIFRQRTWLTTLAIGILALGLFGFLFYNRYRMKQKQVLNEALIREQQLGLNAVIAAQDAEQKRIARDLHDGIAQQLVAMKLGFEAYREIGDGNQFAAMMKSFEQVSSEVRNLSHVMSPPVLEHEGLPGSLQMLLQNSLGVAGIRHQFENLGLNERMTEKAETGLYRIAQELINNILKHAHAANVIVQLQKLGSYVIMRIEDNGKGFDFESSLKKGSMGLLNILSRVSTLKGSFISEPAIPKGTVSVIRIPLGAA